MPRRKWKSKTCRAEVEGVDFSSSERCSQQVQKHKQVSFRVWSGKKQRTDREGDSTVPAMRSRHAHRKNHVCFQEETLDLSQSQFVTVSTNRSARVKPNFSGRSSVGIRARFGGKQIRAERLASAAHARAHMERRTWEGRWKFYYELNAFKDCASNPFDFDPYLDTYNPEGWVWDYSVNSARPTARSKPSDIPVLTTIWKHHANAYARWSFEFLQRDFVEKHGERIVRDLMFLAGSGKYHDKSSIYRDFATWHEPVVSMRPAPLSTDVKHRFLQACYQNEDAVLTPAYHGTNHSNFKRIFERGLLVPGESSGVRSVHGQVDGPGVYTACLSNPMLPLDFCEMEPCDAKWSSPYLMCQVDIKQSHQRCTNADNYDKAAFLRKLSVVPWGVLGDAERAGSVHRASAPSVVTAIVDPAGLHYIKSGPGGAGGAAGAIYKWLGIDKDCSFPEGVSEAIQCEGDVALQVYGDRTVIHAVGPDLRGWGSWRHHEAIRTLSACYAQILTKFAEQSNLSCLRLLPISGGTFSGTFLQMMPEITVKALAAGFAQLHSETQCKLLDAMTTIELCIYSDAFPRYAQSTSSYAQQVSTESVEECMCASRSLGKVCSELLVCAVLDDDHDAKCSSCTRKTHTVSGSTTAVKHARDALVVADDAHVVPLFVASIALKLHRCAVPRWRFDLSWRNRDPELSCTKCVACAKLARPQQPFDEYVFEDVFYNDVPCAALQDDKKKSKRIGRRCFWPQLRRSMVDCKCEGVHRRPSKQAQFIDRQHSLRQLQRFVQRSEREKVQKQRTKNRSHERWEKHVATAFTSARYFRLTFCDWFRAGLYRLTPLVHRTVIAS